MADPSQLVRHLGHAYHDCAPCQHGDHPNHQAEGESSDGRWTVNCRCPGYCAIILQFQVAEFASYS